MLYKHEYLYKKLCHLYGCYYDYDYDYYYYYYYYCYVKWSPIAGVSNQIDRWAILDNWAEYFLWENLDSELSSLQAANDKHAWLVCYLCYLDCAMPRYCNQKPAVQGTFSVPWTCFPTAFCCFQTYFLSF